MWWGRGGVVIALKDTAAFIGMGQNGITPCVTPGDGVPFRIPGSFISAMNQGRT